MRHTITEIIEEWEQGMITTHEVYPALLELALELPIDEIFAATPEPWRSGFLDWLKQTYENDVPEEDFVWLHSSAAEPVGARRVIALAREWLRRQANHPPDEIVRDP